MGCTWPRDGTAFVLFRRPDIWRRNHRFVEAGIAMVDEGGNNRDRAVPADLAADRETLQFHMSKFIRLRVFIGVVSLGVLYVSASFANGLFHSPYEGAA